MLSINIDVDWAPDPLVIATRDLLDRYGVRGTFFVTHELDVDFGQHEVALHPNVLGFLQEGKTAGVAVESLHRIYPRARGVRCHSLCASTRFYPIYAEYGLEYESAFLCYGVHGLEPFWMVNRIVQLPIFWEDDLHMELAAQHGHERFDLGALQIDRPGLKVFVFHPVHLALNTDTLDRYMMAKPRYHEPDALRQFRNTHVRGTEDFLLTLLGHIQQHGLKTHTLNEIATAWRRSQET